MELPLSCMFGSLVLFGFRLVPTWFPFVLLSILPTSLGFLVCSYSPSFAAGGAHQVGGGRWAVRPTGPEAAAPAAAADGGATAAGAGPRGFSAGIGTEKLGISMCGCSSVDFPINCV